MAYREVSRVEIAEVVRRWQSGESQRQIARSLSEKQCSKRYASLVECKDANYSTTKSRLL